MSGEACGPYTDVCPQCGERYARQCRCLRGDRTCPNGHAWYRCRSCKQAVTGHSDHSDPNAAYCAGCAPRRESGDAGAIGGVAKNTRVPSVRTMSQPQRIAERITVTSALDGGGSVDKDAHALRSVVLCGFESINGRRYPRDVLAAECGKYDGAKVYLNHSREGRLFHEWVGVVQRPKIGADGRPRGDIQLFRSEPASHKVIEAADLCPGKFGMSHVVLANTRREGGVDVVEGYHAVESVDIVTDPATNPGGLFEGKNVAKIKFRQLLEAVEPTAPPDLRKRLRKQSVLWEDDAAMAPMLDAPVDEPDAGGDPDDQLLQGFKSAIDAVWDQYTQDKDAGAAVKAIAKYIKAHAKLTGGPDGDVNTDDGDDAPAEEGKKTRVDYPGLLKECGLASYTPTDLDLVALTAMTADQRREYIGDRKRTAEGKGAETPRSAGREQAKAPVKESKGEAADAQNTSFAWQD